MGGSSAGTSSQITSWVEDNYKKVTVGSATFYDLTQPTSVAAGGGRSRRFSRGAVARGDRCPATALSSSLNTVLYAV